MITGIGVDTVAVTRFTAQLCRAPRLLPRLFTPAEQGLKPASLAARFAAKETLIKALGGSTVAGLSLGWHDIEILGGSGKPPSFKQTPQLQRVFAALRVEAAHLSLSHDGDVAIAFVVLENLTAQNAAPVGAEGIRPAVERLGWPEEARATAERPAWVADPARAEPAKLPERTEGGG
ncbi:holo-ACP synthase [Leucobacter sp. OH1287]|uniref:holo-ACP synthase n=1 Tax=Leucobacter sp. OH1287 TaxID=2491049 RepID=UPI000F5E1254|nr:holo-ACP synthase [Leucobacter sp. OH1287]